MERSGDIVLVSVESEENEGFFVKEEDMLYGVPFGKNIDHKNPAETFRSENLKKYSVSEFTTIFLRIERSFDYNLETLKYRFPKIHIVEDPLWANYYHNKRHLLDLQKELGYPDWMPQMDLVENFETFNTLQEKYQEFVLKPTKGSGGRAVLSFEKDSGGARIMRNGDQTLPFEDGIQMINQILFNRDVYLIQELLDISQSDSRCAVINGEIVTSFKRTPKGKHYLANVGKGGTISMAEPDADELQIVETLIPMFADKGIHMFGIDTMVDFNGKRKLTEINVSNTAGFSYAERLTGEPVVANAARLIWQNILSKN